MSSSNPKSRRDLWLIVLGRCLFPTKTNENHGASKSSVGSRKQLISSCLDLVIADFWSTSCAHQGGLHDCGVTFFRKMLMEKKIYWRKHNFTITLSFSPQVTITWYLVAVYGYGGSYPGCSQYDNYTLSFRWLWHRPYVILTSVVILEYSLTLSTDTKLVSSWLDIRIIQLSFWVT